MELAVVIGDRSADVLRGNEKIATMKLDSLAQLDGVILFPRATPEERERILRLAGTHAAEYVKHHGRSALGGPLVVAYGNRTLSIVDSHRLLSFDAPVAAHVAGMSVKSLMDSLQDLSIPVIDAAHYTFEDALNAAVRDRRLGCTIRYSASLDMLGELAVTFMSPQCDAFRFWRNVIMPLSGGGLDLHVVPRYHPKRQTGRTEVAMVNGDTDGNIRGKAVRYLFSPKAARISDGVSSTWSKLKHPFYAAGNGFSAKLIPMQILSKEGVEEVVQMLLGALERDGKYIVISGGFRPPVGTPAIHHAGRQLGSEQFCYWARQVLEEEGELAGAHIPSWM